jgi:hypothetical protein
MFASPGRQRFEVATPLDTHWAPAHCKDVDCSAFQGGFVVSLDETNDKQKELAEMIRHTNHGRHFTETKESGSTRFIFPPGERCFERHMRKLDKPELYTHAVAGGVRRFSRGVDWTENMNEQMYRVERSR